MSRKLTFTDDVSGFTSYSFKPQMRTVGPKYGKLLGKIRQMLPALDGSCCDERAEDDRCDPILM